MRSRWRTEDMPMVASVAVAAAAVAVRRGTGRGRPSCWRAAIAVRGADDATNPEIVRLGVCARARRSTREAALELLSRTAPVRA